MQLRSCVCHINDKSVKFVYFWSTMATLVMNWAPNVDVGPRP